MKITYFGATKEVTGSCHILEVSGKKILLDCGLIQGRPADELRNQAPFPFDPQQIDSVVLSHSHIDHSGRLPLLIKRGFRGNVYTQNAAMDLCKIMLKDAAFISEKDAEWENRKRKRKGLKLIEPLYTVFDAENIIEQFVGLRYDEKTEICDGVTIRLQDAGHILGSSIVEVWLSEHGQNKKVVFSGDLGHKGAPILEDPTIISDADLVIMEGTYGDRLHKTSEDTELEIGGIIEQAFKDGGNILIPSFAVGRTQDILYLFNKNYEKWGLDRWQIFLDSPMAIEATEVYQKYSHLYDDETLALFKSSGSRLLPKMHYMRSAEDSMSLNKIESGAIIIAGSGMCTGGRIRHHLKHNLWKRNCHVMIVGFQVQGTPGRALINGASYVKLLGETIKVQANIHTVGGMSAHADQKALMDWYAGFKNRPPVALVHGEDSTLEALAWALHDRYQTKVTVPVAGETVDLLAK